MPASPVHHTATVDEPWDGPAATAAMPNDRATLTYCHAWHEADAGDEKSGYSFPHHKTKGGPANLAACRNGLARLDEADIPEGDKIGVKRHLQSHLDDAEGSEDRARRVPAALRNVAWTQAVVRAHTGASPVTGRAVPDNGERRRPWEIRDAVDEDGGVEILLYTEVGGWFGVWADEFAADLARISAKSITVRVNSPGGDVFEGIAIMNSLIAHPASITVRVDGLAASIASVICLAGDRVVMGHSTQMMIHNASTMAWGDAREMDATAALLRQISGVIAQAYADRTGTPVEEWQARMDAETWITAEDCVRLGLADEVGTLPARGEPPTGVDPDPENRAPQAPAAAMRPAAKLNGAAPAGAAPAGPPPVAAAEPTEPDGDESVEPDGDEGGGPAPDIDVAVVGQIMGWALAVDQHVDRLIAECAAALDVPNPDVDTDGPPPPLPGGPAGLAYALGILTAVDTVVDGAQVVLAAALGIPNPDPDEHDGGPAPAGPRTPAADTTGGDPILAALGTQNPPPAGDTTHTPPGTWADITNSLFPAAGADPVLAALEGASK
jgi:ATP-dependent protease ClpP protease subunit